MNKQQKDALLLFTLGFLGGINFGFGFAQIDSGNIIIGVLNFMVFFAVSILGLLGTQTFFSTNK